MLVDRGTASAAEIVTGALQDRDRAKVVGTHTYGKGVFQEIEQLSNGGALDITVGEYFTPSGHNLGGGGVAKGRGHHAQHLRAATIRTRKRTGSGRRGADRRRRTEVSPGAGTDARARARGGCAAARASSSWPSRSSALGPGWP